MVRIATEECTASSQHSLQHTLTLNHRDHGSPAVEAALLAPAQRRMHGHSRVPTPPQPQQPWLFVSYFPTSTKADNFAYHPRNTARSRQVGPHPGRAGGWWADEACWRTGRRAVPPTVRLPGPNVAFASVCPFPPLHLFPMPRVPSLSPEEPQPQGVQGGERATSVSRDAQAAARTR